MIDQHQSPLGPVTGLVDGIIQGPGLTVGGVESTLGELGVHLPSVAVSLPAAEPGQSTTEAKMAAVKSLVLAVFGVLGGFGVVHVPIAVQASIAGCSALGIAAISFGYSVSRGLRKRGTA
jgi:hypothetical protein